MYRSIAWWRWLSRRWRDRLSGSSARKVCAECCVCVCVCAVCAVCAVCVVCIMILRVRADPLPRRRGTELLIFFQLCPHWTCRRCAEMSLSRLFPCLRGAWAAAHTAKQSMLAASWDLIHWRPSWIVRKRRSRRACRRSGSPARTLVRTLRLA